MKHFSHRVGLGLFTAFVLAAASAHAQSAASPSAASPSASSAAATSERPWVNAEVRRIDTDAAKVTLKHADIPNLDMPPMTMVFQVSEPALLRDVKAGDKVQVTLDQIKGAYTVMSLRPAR